MQFPWEEAYDEADANFGAGLMLVSSLSLLVAGFSAALWWLG